jgi:DNA repair/transcription protein MET18/MMS19
LALSNLDPLFVDEAARGFGILAEGKGKGKERGSHLTTKVSAASHPTSPNLLTQ